MAVRVASAVMKAAVGVLLVLVSVIAHFLKDVAAFLVDMEREVMSPSSPGVAKTKRRRRLASVDLAANLVQAELERHLGPAEGDDLADHVRALGYDFEEHTVTTKDGYKLALHRIPGKRGEQRLGPKPVAFLQHGLKCSSADWHIGGLCYVMSERGYDVWMGNFRGNSFSREHVHLKESDAKFWHFTWDEHGAFDLPAMMDYVKSCTGVTSMHYVAHSMGTTALFVMLNQYPERNADILRCVALAPVTRVANLSGYPSWFVPLAELLVYAAHLVGINAIAFPKLIPGYSFMALIVLYATGYKECSHEMIKKILKFSPNSTSTRTLLHYIECNKTKQFRTFSGSDTYSLTHVKCPVDIWWSEDDWAVGRSDVQEIAKQLPNVHDCTRVELDRFGHLDFMWSTRIRTLHLMIADRGLVAPLKHVFSHEQFEPVIRKGLGLRLPMRRISQQVMQQATSRQ